MFDFATSTYGGERQQYMNFSTAAATTTKQLDMPSLSPVSMCQRPSSTVFNPSAAATDPTTMATTTGDNGVAASSGRKRAAAAALSETNGSDEKICRFVVARETTKKSSREANQQLRKRKLEATHKPLRTVISTRSTLPPPPRDYGATTTTSVAMQSPQSPRDDGVTTTSVAMPPPRDDGATTKTSVAMPPPRNDGATTKTSVAMPPPREDDGATVIRSFHDFGLMLNLYGLTTQEDRDHIKAKLSSKLTETERRFCNGDDVQRKRVRDVFHALCFGLDANPDRAKFRLIDRLRNNDFSISLLQQQPATEKIMLKYIDFWYDYATEILCAWNYLTAEDIDGAMRNYEARSFILRRACRSCIHHFIRLNQYGRLCPKLVKCREAVEIRDTAERRRTPAERWLTREKGKAENKIAKPIARPVKAENASMPPPPQKRRQKLPPSSSLGRAENTAAAAKGASSFSNAAAAKGAPSSSSFSKAAAAKGAPSLSSFSNAAAAKGAPSSSSFSNAAAVKGDAAPSSSSFSNAAVVKGDAASSSSSFSNAAVVKGDAALSSSSFSSGKNLAALLRYREATMNDNCEVNDEGYDDSERFLNEIDDIVNMHTTDSVQGAVSVPVDDDKDDDDFEDCEEEEDDDDDDDFDDEDFDDEDFASIKTSFQKKN